MYSSAGAYLLFHSLFDKNNRILENVFSFFAYKNNKLKFWKPDSLWSESDIRMPDILQI